MDTEENFELSKALTSTEIQKKKIGMKMYSQIQHILWRIL